ncbi:unnamed protein product [Rhizoctonia solani]|uniref:CCHC-type domain-containing protein n=1 Tax=Rhizoctonia solani TaxID=456999 RepID=A0A8H3A1Q9_9AGAM|nr:unnamed protein product [Rhizoctonia solani]
MNENCFKNKEQRMVWVLYNLEGKVADWASPIIGEVMGQKATAPQNMNELGEQFKVAFTDPDAKRAAGQKITNLQQETSSADYVTEFCNVAADLDWNNSALQDQFLWGLHWKVKEIISQQDTQHATLEELFSLAIHIDNVHQENQESHPRKSNPPVQTPTSTTSTTSITSTIRQVELAKLPNYVSPEEQDHCQAEGLCVKCGEKGHVFRACQIGWRAPKGNKEEKGKVGEDESIQSGKD